MTTKDTELRVRVSPADKARLEAAASARGLSLSAWIRMVAMTAANQQTKESAERATKVLQDLIDEVKRKSGR